MAGTARDVQIATNTDQAVKLKALNAVALSFFIACVGRRCHHRSQRRLLLRDFQTVAKYATLLASSP
ncbi:MAG: hypothetical protein ACREEJ_13270 [Ensifer adhaerens]